MNPKSAKSLRFVKEEELSWLNTHSAPVTHTFRCLISLYGFLILPPSTLELDVPATTELCAVMAGTGAFGNERNGTALLYKIVCGANRMVAKRISSGTLS